MKEKRIQDLQERIYEKEQTIKELREDNENMQKAVEDLIDLSDKHKEEIESLKCCGNCDKTRPLCCVSCKWDKESFYLGDKDNWIKR